jgi:hypothetical protein
MNKNIVFDFDETIGYFEQIIDIIKCTKKTSKIEVFEFLELFPLIFRTNVFDIFYYVVRLKKDKKIKSVILYSNNNNETFIGYVLAFINKKINYNLFDLSISLNQTQNKNKNLNDLMNCSNGLLTKKSCIFFIDDKEYNDMKCIKYYIKCEPYKYIYSTDEIENKVNIVLNSEESKKTKISKTISQSVYSMISKEIINKIRMFVMIN